MAPPWRGQRASPLGRQAPRPKSSSRSQRQQSSFLRGETGRPYVVVKELEDVSDSWRVPSASAEARGILTTYQGWRPDEWTISKDIVHPNTDRAMELLSSLELWREWGPLPPLLGHRDPNKTRWKFTPAGKSPAQCRALSGCSRNESHSEPTAGGLGPFPKWRVSVISAFQLAGQIFQAVGSLLLLISFVSPHQKQDQGRSKRHLVAGAKERCSHPEF